MALNLDSSRPLRTYEQLRGLVRAIYESDDPGAEDVAVEWKSSLELDKPSGAFHAARTILGLANRPVGISSQRFGGLGYLVVGVEPGNLTDMPRWDGEKLGPALERYIGGDGPSWSHHNITFNQANVLVFTVEPPAAGDGIHTLRKEYSGDAGGSKRSAGEGTIFVRHGGRTDRASSADIANLQRRLLSGATNGQPDVSLGSNAPSYRALQIDLVPDELENWLDGVLQEYIQRMEGGKTARPLTAAALGILTTESRTESEYRREVQQYIDKYRKAAPDLLRYIASKAALEHGALQLSLTNNEQEALEDVLIEISTGVNVEQYFAPGPWPEPATPRMWGAQPYFQPPKIANLASIATANTPALEWHSDRWISRQELAVLHSETTVNLEPMTVLAGLPVADEAIAVRVSARNRRGSVEFRLPIDFIGTWRWSDLKWDRK